MRAVGWQTPVRNESECGLATEVGLALSCGDAPSTDHDPLVKDLSMSIYVGTRKMVNYA